MISFCDLLLGVLTLSLAPFIHATTLTNNSAPALTSALFSADVTLGKALPQIPISGGVRAVQPITGGTVSGPVLNASIAGGLAYPTFIEKGTTEVPQIILYGVTPDNSSYLIQISGIGSPLSQVARVTFEIGGRYAALTDDFIVASIVPTAVDRSTVKVQGYGITLG